MDGHRKAAKIKRAPVTYSIQERERFNASPKPGERSTWTEYQVLHGNKIIERCATRAEAHRRLEALQTPPSQTI